MTWRLDSRFFVALMGNYFPVRIMVCAVACAVLPLSDAQATVLTGQFQSLNVLGGEYRVNNNVWGASTAQQVTTFSNGTYFEVTLSNHNQTSVASYPFIQKGVHFGGANTTNSGMPVRINEVTAAPFTWNVDTESAGGTWNAAFESWFSTTGGTSPNGAELMIWIDYQGQFYPGGDFVTNVSIGGLDWRLSYSPNWGAWDYIAYQLLTPTNEVSLDLKAFMDDSLARAYLNPAWFLDNMEAGFEIMSDGKNLKTNSFSAQVITGLPGDYNGNDQVDAADYTIWRDTLGSTTDLRANGDNTGTSTNVIDLADFTFWKTHFGQPGSGAGGIANAAVPEPATLLLLSFAAAGWCLRRSRAA